MLHGTLPSGTWIADAHGKSGSSRSASWASAGYVGANAPGTTAAACTFRPALRAGVGAAEQYRYDLRRPRAATPRIMRREHPSDAWRAAPSTAGPAGNPVVAPTVPPGTMAKPSRDGPHADPHWALVAGRPAGHGGCSSAGRAPGCGPGGRGFKSRHPPQVSEHVDLPGDRRASIPGPPVWRPHQSSVGGPVRTPRRTGNRRRTGTGRRISDRRRDILTSTLR